MSRFALTVCCVVALLLFSNQAIPAADQPAVRGSISMFPPLPAELHQALQDRQFAVAIQRIDAELAKPQRPDADYLLYLRGRAQTELGLYEPAVATFKRLQTEYPKSPWESRAWFGQAEVLFRQRNYQDAGAIYEKEAARLLSDGRRDELANIYLEFADRFFDGYKDESKPGSVEHDYKQALEFYRQALTLKPGLPKRQQVELRIARCLQEMGDPNQAIEALTKFVADYGTEAEAKNRAATVLQIEAQYQLGKSLLDVGRRADARKTWQDLLASPAFRVADSPFLTQAQYRIAQTYGVPNPPTDGDLELGVAALEAFLKAHPKGDLAPAAELDIALSYGSRGRYEPAVARLRTIVGNKIYAASEQAPQAANLLGEILFSQRKFGEAIKAWREFLAAYPNHRAWKTVLERIIDAEYGRAEFQFRQKQYPVARELWQAFLKEHPLDSRAPEILYNFGWMKYTEGTDRVSARLQEGASSAKNVDPADTEARNLFTQAIEEWRRLISKYPAESEESSKKAAVLIGVVLEERLGRLDEAIRAYQKAAADPINSEEAKRRLVRLTEKQMDVLTPRKFRAKEHPFVRLSTRNVDKLTVKVYRVELADYFRKMHLATGVESLDVALIDPDRSFDVAVKNYEKYRPFQTDVEIPVQGPGVWAVTVASDKLEATTMVVVSDLDLIVKCSRNELFVFAEDVVEQKPAAGTRLLLSDGSRVFAEEVTDNGGVLQKPFDVLKSVRDLRVFAIRKGHVASTVNPLEGLDFAVGLTPAGHIDTDRPAYRAGELVNLRGIVRWVSNDRFVFNARERYKLEVADPRGRTLHTGEVLLDRFGAFATSFLLPDVVPQGECSVRLFQLDGKQSYATQFTVHEAKLEPIRIEVELPRKVYFRGETIEGKIRLKYYYGTPLADREIQYRLADDRIHTAKTNTAGEVSFEFPTRRYSESQSLQLSVDYPERNVRTVERVFLAARAFELRLTTVRNVYLSGETFDTTIAAVDPAGQPVATPLKLEILETTTSDNRAGERLIESFDLKTDKDKGIARQTLKIARSGKYVLRATAIDRFGTPVSGAHHVMISGEDDDVRLRILAERHNYQLGDKARLNLLWRQPKALALVAFEGASILDHRLVELKTGLNPLEFVVDSNLAPNFVLSVAVIDQTRLHQASSDFAIAKRLRITITPKSARPVPGEPLAVEVTTTDPQGKPVVAELSLGMVERSLLDFFKTKNAALDQVFAGVQRKPSMRTMTSCSFLYHPKTRGISEALLAEEQRRRAVAAEDAARRSLPAIVASESSTSGSTGAAVDFESRLEELLNAGRFGEAESVVKEASRLTSNRRRFDEIRRRVQLARQAGSGNGPRLSDLQLGTAIDDLEPEIEVIDADGSWGWLFQRGVQFAPEGMGGMGGGMFGRANQPAQTPRRPATREERLSGRLNEERPMPNAPAPVNAARLRGRYLNGAKVFDEKSRADQQGKTEKQADALDFFSANPQVDNGKWYFAYTQNPNGEILSYNLPGNSAMTSQPVDNSGKNGRILPASALGETGYWNPAVVTGSDGKAIVTIVLPPKSTAWKVRSAGIDAESLAGDAEIDLVAKKDFFGEMKLPPAFTAGDRAEILVDVQNSSIEKGSPITARLKVTLGDRSTELKKTLVSTGPGIESISFPASFPEPGAAQVELALESGNRRDVTRTTVPVKPFGVPVTATASGTAAQSTIAFVEANRRLAPENPKLEILIGPSIDRTLLDAVLGSRGVITECERFVPVNSLERATSDVLGGVALLGMVRASRTDNSPEVTALNTRIGGAIAQLVAAQRDDGGWAWSGGPRASKSDRVLSSRVVWAFSAARQAGFAVEAAAVERGTAYLSTALAACGPAEREVQAILFHALTAAAKGEFSVGNRLYRDRNALSPGGLVYVALALAKLDRKEMAGELLNLVKINVAVNPGNPPSAELLRGAHLPVQTDIELRALYLLALEEVRPADEKVNKLSDWLLSARHGSRWYPERANGPAIVALARLFSGTGRNGTVRPPSEKYALSLFVNDRLVEKLFIDPAVDASRRVEVPAKFFVSGQRQKINFDLEGRARFSYSVALSGFVPAERMESTTNDWSVTRTYEPAPRMFDGELIPRGFDVLTGSYSTFQNNLTQIPVGERGEVTLNVWRRFARGTADEQHDYLVITEPIPAGATVLVDSVQGTFERYEISPAEITFYVGDAPYPGTFHYTLVGYAPGSFRAVPTVVRSFYHPQQVAISSRKSLDVLPKGVASHDEYKLSPRELFELGKRLVAKGRFAEGAEHLARLVKQYRLRDEVYRESIQALFKAALATGQDSSIVENFEIIKEKLPGVEVDFDSILRVALAYRKLGEYERGFLVYRATLEALFQRESQIAGFLDDRDQFLRSVQVMERLLREYPAESYIATATSALAQEVLGKADAAPGSEELKKLGLTRVDLVAASISMFDHFLSTWPNDPAADQAAFATVSALLKLDKYETAIARCRRDVDRYPGSVLADSFWYVIGYSEYALGHSDQALEICRKVAGMTRKDPQSGTVVPAQNKWQAIYIEGQIYHSLNKPAEAISEYQQVKEMFPDAREAIQYFVHRKITLPEVTTVRPGEPVTVPLSFRNVPRVDLKVYRVDLLKFGLMQRNLARLTAINLAGIRPYHELTIDLGNGKDYRDRDKPLTLPLKEEGAYLVVCRGGDDYASGLVLVSPLEMSVQEDSQSGRVRVTVKDAVADRYLRNVLVKVIGSKNPQFQTGETDLRGLFTADGIRGTSTAIARAENNRYAFFRGTTQLAEVSNDDSRRSQSSAVPQAPAKAADKDKLLQNVNERSSELQQQQRDSYRSLLRNKKTGVKAGEAF